MNLSFRIFYGLLIALFLGGCSSLFESGSETEDPGLLSDGGSETEGLYGTLVLEDGEPASGALITITSIDEKGPALLKVKTIRLY